MMEAEGGEKHRIKVLSKHLSFPCQVKIKIKEKGKPPKRRKVSMGVKKVRFIFHEEWIWMVAVRGLGKEIIVLLTNLKIEGKEDLLKILEIYLTRWKCEESYRFIKQAYHLEDVRVRKFNSLRNILAILMSVFFFLSVVIGEKLRLQILLKKIYEKAKRFYQIPPFKYYALCDGIFNILFGKKFAPSPLPPPPSIPYLFLPFEPLKT